MAQKVELRKRSGGNFSGNDNLMLPVTHVDFVLGLLDENSNKLKTSLLPSSMLNTKRMAGSINADTDFGDLYELIETFNDSDTQMYPGTYFISNGKRLISSSPNHVIYYNDDNLNASSSVELENGDHLFYVKFGSEYAWNDTTNTVSVDPGDGVVDLTTPYNSIQGSNIFASVTDAAAVNPLSSGIKALITGFKWVSVSFSEYNATGYKIDKTASIGSAHVEADVNRFVIPTWKLWDYGQESVGLSIEEPEITTSYWKLTRVDTTIEDPKVYESTVHSDKHIWGVVNNTYDLATTTSAGLMSAVDKTKLNSLSNYVHHSQAKISLDTSGVEVLDMLEVDTQGHTTKVTKRTLPNATTSTAGVMSAADKNKLEGIEVGANKYSHPTQGVINANTLDDGQTVIGKINVNTLGHVTSITTRELTAATTDKVGVIELATKNEAIVGTDAGRALTPSTGLSLLNYHQDMSYFANLSSANDATLPDGATAIIVTGSITI